MSYKKNYKKKSSNLKVNTMDAKQSRAIISMQRQIKQLKNNPEIKYFYHVRADAPSATPTSTTLLNNMVKGTGSEDRIGDEVILKSIFLSMWFRHIGTDNTLIRVILFNDATNKESTGVVISDLLSHTASTGDMLQSCYNKQYVGKGNKFQILYDQQKSVWRGTSAQNFSWPLQINKRLGHKVRYTTNLGTGADILNNALRLLVIASNTNAQYAVSGYLSYCET